MWRFWLITNQILPPPPKFFPLLPCLLHWFQSDPDQGPGSPHRSPSPTDDVFLGPTSSPPCHAPPPPPYMPPQPSIEEARQQMHSLLDDAFALVSPTSQGSTAGITLPGVNTKTAGSSPPGRDHRPWAPSYSALSPFPGVSSPPSSKGRFTLQDLVNSVTKIQFILWKSNHIIFILDWIK